MSNRFSVGFGRMDISPTESVPLAGYGNNLQRMSQGILDPLMATCIAIEDAQGQVMLLCTVDHALTFDFLWKPVVEAVSEKYGISRDAIVISSTHTHSAPDTNLSGCPASVRYRQYMVERIIAAADAAMADRKPASLSYGHTHNEGLNYVRHYILENGTYAGPNFGNFDSSPIARHISEPDRQIQLLRMDREGGKSILMVNWQCHALVASVSNTEHGRKHRPYVSADFIGGCRDYVETETGMLFAFFQGAGGNLNPQTRMDLNANPQDHMEFGRALGRYVISGLDNLTPMTSSTICAKRAVHSGPADHSQDHLVPQAQEIADCWAKENDKEKCAQMGAPYGINSPYHAGAILRKARFPERLCMEVGAGAVGDVGFVFLPYEAFDTNGIYIKENSPYKQTFVVTCANGFNTYIPSKLGFTYSCYEHNACGFAPGTGEAVAELMVSMLNALHTDA